MAIPTPEMYFPLDGNANNTEGTNGSATGISWVTGFINDQCAEFSDEGDGISALEIDVTSGLSISCWVYIDSTVGERFIVSDRDQSVSNTWSFILRINSGTLEWYVKDGGNNNILCTFTPSTGTLYHIVATYDGTNSTLYINGSSEDTATATTSGFTNANNSTYIGCMENTGGLERSFDGKIDEVGIWLEELSSTDVSDLYNSGTGKVWNGSSWAEPSSNTAPTISNPSPSNDATGVSTSPTLSIDVSDADGDSCDVTFYNASDDSVIGSDNSVASGGTASVTWSGLSNNTTYTWYAKADDGTDITTSPDYSFTTEEAGATVKIMQSGSWTTATVKVRQSGNWVSANIKSRQSGSWN